MEFDAVHVREVPGVDPQRVRARERPQARRAVLRAAAEIKAAGADVHVPHRVGVALVQDAVGEAAQVPVADGGVLRTREQAGAVGQEGGPEHGTAVTPQRLYLTSTAAFLVHLETNELLLYPKPSSIKHIVI